MAYPRVLHLCVRPMGSKSGTGLTFGRLYEVWPDDRLMQFCLQFDGTAGRGRMALIPATVSPADGARRLKSQLTTLLQHHSEQASGFPSSFPKPHGELRAVAGKVLETLPIWLSPTARDYILDFDPQVIHFGPWGIRSMRLATRLSRELAIPVVPHYMDTDLDTGYLHRRLGKAGRNLETRVHSQLLSRAPICLTIGTDMAVEYSGRLERPCVVAGNCVSDQAFTQRDSPRHRETSGRVFYYAGSLHHGRAEVIATLASALQRTHNSAWRIEINTPPVSMRAALDLQARHDNVTVLGSLEPAEVGPKLASADFLLMVESTDLAQFAYTRLSVSTKVPEYLASGRPILAIGPAGQSSLRELNRHGHAVQLSPDDLTQDPGEVLDRLLALEAPAPSFAAQPVDNLVGAFGSTAVRERFREVLSLACRAGPKGRVAGPTLPEGLAGFAAVDGKLME